MAKAKKKRSAARARAKRRPCKAPPEQLRLSPEALEKFRPRLPESEPEYSRLDRAIAHMSGITGSPPPAAETTTVLRATIKDHAVAVAQQMKAAGEIPEGVHRKPFAEELARRIGEPEKWNYIRKDMAEWGIWPIAEIKPPKGRT